MITLFHQPLGRSCLTQITNRLLASSILLAAAVQLVAGPAIYKTEFEPRTFVDDSPLAGQDGWIAPPPLSPNAAVVTRDKPHRGRQSVHVLGEDLEHQDFINELTGGYYDAIGSYRRAVDYDTEGTQSVRVSAEVRVDGPKTGVNFFSASLSTRAATMDANAGVGEIAISSDGHVYAYTGNENVPTFLASTRVQLGHWHQLMIVADFAAHTSSFFVDGHCLGTFAFDPAENYTGVFLRGSLIAYVAPDTARLKKADYAAHFDKVSIEVVSKRDRDKDRDRDDRDED